jgi:hypothetical protein
LPGAGHGDLMQPLFIFQGSLGAFGSVEARPTPWARGTLGLRADGHCFDVASDNPANSGTVWSGILSPKAGLVLGPWHDTESFYASRLPGETRAYEDRHLHPAEPRTFRIAVTCRFYLRGQSEGPPRQEQAKAQRLPPGGRGHGLRPARAAAGPRGL